MPIRSWHDAVDSIRPDIVRIQTPDTAGTGFLLSVGRNKGIYAIATAAHVIAHAQSWEDPIKLEHLESGQSVFLRATDRVIRTDLARDTAAILFHRSDLRFPESAFQLLPVDKHLKVGSDVGWLGYPALSPESLCFFGGRISAWLQSDSAYLVDGVAINGVSGGPTFFINPDGNLMIIGVISSYMPNRVTGESLPGLSVVRSVYHLHEVADGLSAYDITPPQPQSPSDK